MNENEIKHKNEKHLKKILSEQLGIEPGDIQNDYSLVEDLHMNPSALTDFLETLSDQGYDTKGLDFKEIITIEDLIDFMSLNEI